MHGVLRYIGLPQHEVYTSLVLAASVVTAEVPEHEG